MLVTIVLLPSLLLLGWIVFKIILALARGEVRQLLHSVKVEVLGIRWDKRFWAHLVIFIVLAVIASVPGASENYMRSVHEPRAYWPPRNVIFSTLWYFFLSTIAMMLWSGVWIGASRFAPGSRMLGVASHIIIAAGEALILTWLFIAGTLVSSGSY